MSVHSVARKARSILPSFLFSVIRRVGTAILTPVSFSYHSGHFLSSMKSRAVDRQGQPLPWYTYPAIHFLECKDFSDKTILEFGAGQSTLWWSKRAKEIISFESDLQWYNRISRFLEPNVALYFTSNDIANIDRHLDNKLFDVIIIDGLDRLACAEKSIKLLADDGAVLADNSEGYWGPEGSYPIMELYRHAGFLRVDFYGYAPGVILPHCTSLFFKKSCFFLLGSENPGRKVF